MTHDELLQEIDVCFGKDYDQWMDKKSNALRAVVELHKPTGAFCAGCGEYYDTCTTIKTITDKLN